jgi:futalosine hydrolase
LVIQAGIAGSFTEKYTLGETVIAFQDTFGDMGAEEKENLSTIFDMGLANKDEFPYKNGWLVNPNDYLQQSSLKKAIAVTVNKVTDNPLQTKQLLLKFTAEIESMEGAALHYVCLQEKIAFIQLRGISNYVGERDKSKWKMKEAINSLNKELAKVFEELKKKN